MTPEELAQAIEAAVLAAVESGSIDRDTLAQVIVGPSIDRQSLYVWALDAWENYSDHAPSDAFAEIPHTALLDDIDALLPGNLPAPTAHERRTLPRTIVFADPAVDAAYEDLLQKDVQLVVDALRAIARRQRLGTFKKLVGLMAEEISTSGYADVVTFYHPRGHERLLPIHESRAGDIDLYQWGALAEDGIIMFYAEGAGGQPPGVREYLFADMERWRANDDREVAFRVKGDVHDVALTHGHTHEEWGGPSQMEVDAALLAHFATRPELNASESPAEALTAEPSAAWEKDFLGRTLREQKTVVQQLVASRGVDAARGFVESLPKDHENRGDLLVLIADELTKTAPADALAVFELVPEKTRARAWRKRVAALSALGRFEEIIALCASVPDDDQDAAAPRAALALARLGKRAEALARLDARPEKERAKGPAQWARAVALAGHDEQGALDAFRRALSDDHHLLEGAELLFANSPVVLAEISARRGFDAARRAMDEDVRARRVLGVASLIDLAPEDAIALAYTGSGASTVARWKTISELKIEKGGRVRALLRDENGRVWASAQSAGVVELKVGDDGTLTAAGSAKSTGSIEDLAISGDVAYGADWSVGLSILDVSGAAPKFLLTHPRATSEQTSRLSASGAIVALCGSRGVQVYDVSTPTSPVLLSVAGVGSTGEWATNACDVALEGDTLFVAAGGAGLVVVDLKDPRAPRVLSAIAVEASEGKNFRAETVEIESGVAFLSSDGRCWLVDVRTPSVPRSICVVGKEGTKADFRAWLPLGDGDDGARRYGVVDEDHPILWVLDVWPDRSLRLVQAELLVDSDGEAKRHYYAESALLLSPSRMLIGKGGDVVLLERGEAPALDTTAVAAIRAVQAPAASWIQERVQAYAQAHPEGGVGYASVSISGDSLSLTLAAPQTVTGAIGAVGTEDAGDAEQTIALSELLSAPSVADDADRADDDVDAGQKNSVLEHLKTAAEEALIVAAADALLSAPALRDAMAGRLYVARDATIFRVLQREDRAWTPHRRRVEERQARSLSERLKDYRVWDAVAEKAKGDEKLRAEIYALLEQGDEGAMHVTRRCYQSDVDGCVAALLRAASKGALPRNHLELLGRFASRDDVRMVLLGLWRELAGAQPDDLVSGRDDWKKPTETATRLLQLATSLSKKDDDKVVQLVRALLGVPKLRYDTMDLAGEAMDLLDARMPELLELLRTSLARLDERDNRVPLLCKHLFRAGHRELPSVIQAQAQGEKRNEQYESVKLGIKELDEVSDENPVTAAERIYTGWMVANRARALAEAGDTTSSLWPPALPPEPFPSSWKHVLAAALPHLLRWGLLEVFIEQLESRALAAVDTVAERALLLGMLEHFQNRSDWVRHTKVADIIRAAPGFDDKTKRGIERRQERVELMRGWEFLKARELPAARAIADALLADEPDGQVFFFDARLKWLEADSPQAGLDASLAHLRDLDGYDPPGRGRLLNLVGAALDELGRTAEALPYFERASRAHPEDPIYLANVAEGHDKLGNREAALRFAKEALQRKVDSEVCRKIVAAS